MDIDQLIKELKFKAIRSGGSGGQHVNKVSSKVVLFFDMDSSLAISDEEKEILRMNLKPKLTKENTLILNCDESRSQHKNKELVILRFTNLIENHLIVQKLRKATKVPKKVVKKRLENKKKHSLKKNHRKKPNIE